LKKVKYNRYLPFVENWKGCKEFPRKKTANIHRDCQYYDTVSRHCMKAVDFEGYKIVRDVRVVWNDLACKNFIKR